MSYIREYTSLTPQEHRQLKFKRRFKEDIPAWDDSMVLLKNLLGGCLPSSRVSILDIGCGHGNFVIDELRQHFSPCVGFDVSGEATRGNISIERVVIGDSSRLPFDDASFDVAISLWVLEHVKDPAAFFSEVSRVLVPGGLFSFVTPNRQALLIAFRRLMSKRFADHLLRRLYGREEEDVFDVYYRANDVGTLSLLAKKWGMDVELLRENADPSYTSFGSLSYALSRRLSLANWSWTKPHIVGIFKKQK